MNTTDKSGKDRFSRQSPRSYYVRVAKSKMSLPCALLILALALFKASPIRAEQSISVNYIKSGMTIYGAVYLRGSAHSDNAPITNIFVTIGGAKVAGGSYNYNSKTVEFDFKARSRVPGELDLVVHAQDASGSTFTSQTFRDYFASELSLRLLAPSGNVSLKLGEGVVIRADADIDFGEVKGIAFWMDNGNGSSKEYVINDASTDFIWYPHEVGTFNVRVRPFVDVTDGPVQDGFFTATVEPWSLPLITRQSLYLGTTNGGKVMLVESSSPSPRRIQWLHNGQAIPGATNSILTIESPQSSDDGYYVAQIDNSAGRVVSAMADQQIDGNGGGLVLFSNHTDEIDAPIYSPGQLPGYPPYIQVKLVAGRAINRLRVVTDWIRATNGYFNAGSITLPNVAPGQKAYVRVIAKDEIPMLLEAPLYGQSPIMEITAGASTPTPLRGLIPFTVVRFGNPYWPRFTPDTPASVRQGGSVELKFTPLESTSGTVTYFWSKNGVPIPGATNATLRIDNAQRSDAGYYTVFMTDGTQLADIGTSLAVEDSVALRLSSHGQLELHGNTGSRYTLQSSTDLKTWSPLQTITAQSDSTAIPVAAPSTGNLFYRAILEPN
jgi:hypothetical protein